MGSPNPIVPLESRWARAVASCFRKTEDLDNWTAVHPVKLVPPWLLTTILIALVVWCLVDIRRRAGIDPANIYLHKTDVTVYTEAGAAFFDGREPYQVTNSRGWSYLYPPLFAMLLAPLHALSSQNQAIIWFAINAVLAWGCYIEAMRLAQLIASSGVCTKRVPQWLPWAALATVTLPALNCLQRGQIGVLKLYLLLAGLRLILANRSALTTFAGGLVLALPIAFKITPILPVAYLLVQQTIAAWYSPARSIDIKRVLSGGTGVTGGLVLYFLLIPAALVGWQANCGHLHTWWNIVGRNADNPGYDQFAGNSHSMRNQSLLNAAYLFGNWADYSFGGGPDDRVAETATEPANLAMEAPWVGRALLAVRLAIATFVAWLAFSLGTKGNVARHAAGFGVATAATLVIAPIARVHYFVLLLPVAVYLPLCLIEQGRYRAAQWFSIVPAALVIAHYLAIDFVGRVGLLGLGTAVWLVTGAALLVPDRRTVRSVDKHSVDDRKEPVLGIPRRAA